MFREGNDRLVIIGIRGIVRLSGQGISSVRCSWAIGELDVILFVLANIPGNSLSYFMWVPVIHQVGMISNNEDWMFGTF